MQGAGLVWATQLGQLEVNLSQVLSRQEHDKVKRGVEIGFVPRML